MTESALPALSPRFSEAAGLAVMALALSVLADWWLGPAGEQGRESFNVCPSPDQGRTSFKTPSMRPAQMTTHKPR
jgi:hypothetical protein